MTQGNKTIQITGRQGNSKTKVVPDLSEGGTLRRPDRTEGLNQLSKLLLFLQAMGKNHVSESSEQLIQQVGQFLVKASESAISDHGYFSIGLSGGSSASIVSKALTSESVCQQINWGKWHIFFCDERYVPLAGNNRVQIMLLYVLVKLPSFTSKQYASRLYYCLLSLMS